MGKKILYIEDNPENGQLVHRILASKGHEVLLRADGLAGIETAKRELPDLILMDINLPGLDGYAAATLIKSLSGLSQTPIIALTANVMKGDRERALTAGCNGYIPKPIDVREFGVQIEAYLMGKKDQMPHQEESVYLKEYNVRLVEKLEKEITELKRVSTERLYNLQRFEERTQELQFLLEATTIIASSLDLSAILNATVSLICKKIPATFCRLILLREERLTLKAHCFLRALPWDGDADFSCCREESACFQRMAREGETSLMQSVEIEAMTPCDEKLLTGGLKGIQSLLIVPILRRETLIGLLSIGEMRQWERTPFTYEKRSLCQASVNQLGQAIENACLFEDVLEKTDQLKAANRDVMQAFAGALEAKDVDTQGHSDRTMAYAREVAQHMGLSEQDQEWACYAALLHDIGKIGIPEQILKKPAKLTPAEYEVMKKHVTYGGLIVRKIKFLWPVVPAVEADHERWDGMGYPRGLKGEEIPILGRIVAVVDAYDAMTADRIYRKTPGQEYAIGELKRCAGWQFDPKVVESFLYTLRAGQVSE